MNYKEIIARNLYKHGLEITLCMKSNIQIDNGALI